MSEKSVQEQVIEAMTPPAESAPAPVVEEASSIPEVKSEEPAQPIVPVEPKVVVEDKSEQLKNLNIALSVEREEKKKMKDELESLKEFQEKLKGAFIPKEPEIIPTEKTEEEKFEEWYSQKENAKKEELSNQELQTKITKQIDDLTKSWDGTDGKPKYDDSEVYKWQVENNKAHLLPEEAFFLMKRDDLIDWKSRELIEKSKEHVPSERPSGISAEHTPASVTPKNDREIRNAVLEALSATE